MQKSAKVYCEKGKIWDTIFINKGKLTKTYMRRIKPLRFLSLPDRDPS